MLRAYSTRYGKQSGAQGAGDDGSAVVVGRRLRRRFKLGAGSCAPGRRAAGRCGCRRRRRSASASCGRSSRVGCRGSARGGRRQSAAFPLPGWASLRRGQHLRQPPGLAILPDLQAALRSPPPGRTARNLTPEERTLRARVGAYRLHALYDPKETTKKARAAFAARFDRQVDPDGVLPPAERARRADAARRAYFTELQLRSSRSRRRM